MALITVIFNGAPLLLQYNLFWGDIYNSLGQRGKTNFYSITYSVDGFCYCCWMLFCLLHLFINCFINIIFDVQFFSFVMFYNILCLCWNGSFWAITFVVFLLVSLSNVIDFSYILILLPISILDATSSTCTSASLSDSALYGSCWFSSIVMPLCNDVTPEFQTNMSHRSSKFSEICFPFPELKRADATCVKIATEMKKCSRLKEISNFDLLWNFQPI